MTGDLRADIEALAVGITPEMQALADEGRFRALWFNLRSDLRDALAAHPAEEGGAVTAEQQASVFKVEGTHHFHGTKCLCGFDSYGRARSATEHITGLTLAALGLGATRGLTEQVKCTCSAVSGPDIECPKHGQCANEGHPCHCGVFGVEVSGRG